MTADDEQEGAEVGTHCALLPGYGAIPEEGLEVKANTRISTNVFANESTRLFPCSSLNGHAVSSTTSRLSRDHSLSHESAIAPCSCLSRPQQESNGKAGKQQTVNGISQQRLAAGLCDLPQAAFTCCRVCYQFYRGFSPVCLSVWVGSCGLRSASSLDWAVPTGNGESLQKQHKPFSFTPQNLLTSRHHGLALLKQRSIWDHSTRL